MERSAWALFLLKVPALENERLCKFTYYKYVDARVYLVLE